MARNLTGHVVDVAKRDPRPELENTVATLKSGQAQRI